MSLQPNEKRLFQPAPKRPWPVTIVYVFLWIGLIFTIHRPWHDTFLGLWLIATLPWVIYKWFWQRRERKYRDRFWRGLCFRCGYDLRGLNERCPECGEPIRPRPDSS